MVPDDVRVIPLILLLYWTNHILWVTAVVIVTTEKVTLSLSSLWWRMFMDTQTGRIFFCSQNLTRQGQKNVDVITLTIFRSSPRHSCSYFFLSDQ